MATSTVGTEFAVMNVVGAMAIGAAIAQAKLHLERSAVTRVAAHIHVSATKCEICLQIVIEAPCGPVDRVVTATAVVAEAPIVRVDFGMTIGASPGRIGKDMRLVACAAFLRGMSAQQWEPRQVMIE